MFQTAAIQARQTSPVTGLLLPSLVAISLTSRLICCILGCQPNKEIDSIFFLHYEIKVRSYYFRLSECYIYYDALTASWSDNSRLAAGVWTTSALYLSVGGGAFYEAGRSGSWQRLGYALSSDTSFIFHIPAGVRSDKVMILVYPRNASSGTVGSTSPVTFTIVP